MTRSPGQGSQLINDSGLENAGLLNRVNTSLNQNSMLSCFNTARNSSWGDIASAPATPFVDARAHRLAQLMDTVAPGLCDISEDDLTNSFGNLSTSFNPTFSSQGAPPGLNTLSHVSPSMNRSAHDLGAADSLSAGNEKRSSMGSENKLPYTETLSPNYLSSNQNLSRATTPSYPNFGSQGTSANYKTSLSLPSSPTLGHQIGRTRRRSPSYPSLFGSGVPLSTAGAHDELGYESFSGAPSPNLDHSNYGSSHLALSGLQYIEGQQGNGAYLDQLVEETEDEMQLLRQEQLRYEQQLYSDLQQHQQQQRHFHHQEHQKLMQQQHLRNQAMRKSPYPRGGNQGKLSFDFEQMSRATSSPGSCSPIDIHMARSLNTSPSQGSCILNDTADVGTNTHVPVHRDGNLTLSGNSNHGNRTSTHYYGPSRTLVDRSPSENNMSPMMYPQSIQQHGDHSGKVSPMRMRDVKSRCMILVDFQSAAKHIYVSDLPQVIDEMMLRKSFRRFGRIDDIRLSKSKLTGTLNGYI
jgi:hypothetical protein